MGVWGWGAGQRFPDRLVPCKMFLILVRVLAIFFTFFTLRRNSGGAECISRFLLNLYVGAKERTPVGSLEKTPALKLKDGARASAHGFCFASSGGI